MEQFEQLLQKYHKYSEDDTAIEVSITNKRYVIQIIFDSNWETFQGDTLQEAISKADRKLEREVRRSIKNVVRGSMREHGIRKYRNY